MKKLLLSIFIALIFLPSSAQNDPQFSLYEFNRLIFNPAATAQSEYVDIHLLAREQWAGFEQAPATQSLSVSNYFSKWRTGAALTVINDKLGAENMQNIKAKYAYHAWLGEEQYISFGLGAGVMMKSFSSGGLILDETGDPNRMEGDYKETKLDFDFGMELHLKHFFIGGAVNHMTQSYNDYDIMRVPRHYYGYAGYTFNPANDVTLTPSFSMSKIENINIYEASLMTNYAGKVWAGLGYRINESFLLSTKVSISEHLQVAYSYDMAAGDLQNYRNGSHEIMLHVRIAKPEKEYKSPRFFD